MTSKTLYRIEYYPIDPTPAEQAADKAKNRVIYRYASNEGQAVIVAKANLPSPAYDIDNISPAPNLSTVDNN